MKKPVTAIIAAAILLGVSNAFAAVSGFKDWCHTRTDVKSDYICVYDSLDECKEKVQGLSGKPRCLHKSDIPAGG